MSDVFAVGTHLTTRAASEAVQMPARTVTAAAGAARHGLSAVEQAPGHAVWVAKALTDLHPRRTHRRVWEHHGHALVEVRGLTGSGSQHRRVAAGVRRALNGLSGVRWAEINAITGQVLVAFDEHRVDVGTLLEAVRAVEVAQGTRQDDFSWERPVHPSDETPVGAAVVELAADCVALTAAVAGRVVRVPRMPRGVRVGLTLLDLQPQLRPRLRARIGPVGTDVLMSLTYAAVNGLSQRPIGPAIDAVYRTELLAEALSRRSVWKRREPELYCSPGSLPDQAPQWEPRPGPLPKGPLETWADVLGPGSLAGAAGVLFLTKEPRRAADTILASAPRAARLGRESFAATAARRLARRGVVPLDASAYRRLDRVSAIVIDSSVLCTDRPQILAAQGEHDDVRSVWRKANRILRDKTMADLVAGTPLTDGKLRLLRDPRVKNPAPGAIPLVLRQGNRRLGRLSVGGELTPLAEALLDAARETGAQVLVSEHEAVKNLLPQTDEVLSAEESLAAHVRRLQEEGNGVLCVTGTAEEALAAADVGVGVLPEGDGCSCWSADLVCGPGLEDAWRVLAVVTAAQPLTQRVVHVAQAATALGTLLALVGGRRRAGKTHALAPVHSSALLGLYQGARAGRRATRRRAPTPVIHVPWHALDPAEVRQRLDELSADNGARPGLSVRRVVQQVGGQARRVADKPVPRRVLAPATGTFALTTAVREELQDPLTPVLALGATASAIVGSAIDALLVATVLSGNAFISGAQRWRAEQSLRQLLVEQTVTAHRVRRGARPSGDVLRSTAQNPDSVREALESLPLKKVRAPGLVPGDVISLRASDVVPADARLIAAWDLEVDESSLTGESVPVQKDVDSTPGVPLPERTCMVFEGTTVLGGSAYAIVVATGQSTEAGRATRAAGRAAPAAGIQARLMEITRMALPATGLGGAGVAGLGLLRGLPLREAIAAGVSVAVAAVPEGLPLVATVAQAGAARRLSRQGVLVRSSRTLEALGRVDTVCFDKTGTLTTGRLAVTLVRTGDNDLNLNDPAAKHTLTIAARACPAVDEGQIGNVPHATDRAVLEAAANGAVQDEWELHSESSFEASRGYSAALGTSNGTTTLAVKGAPEVILPLCTAAAGGAGAKPRRLDDRGRRTAEETVNQLADQGLRLLAVAERTSDLPDHTENLEPLAEDLTLVGFVGISDSPRDSAGEAVGRMIDAGIRPVMVTGDHPATASAIARAVGLPAEQVTTGAELEGMTEDERIGRAAETTIFARVSPEQKVRIVEALRGAGRVVAMTGDGTNDAAAIRLADVGIGVGAVGSSSARSSADLVLAEPDLPRIHDALVEGRQMWHRMREAVSILVGGNAGEVGFMMLGTAAGGRAPINIRQMLVVNLLTDMFPALAVALAPSHRPEEAAAPVGSTLGAPLARAVAIRGTTTALGATLAWTVGRYTGRGRRADTMGLAALVGTQLGQTLLIGWRSPLVVLTTLASVGVLFAVVETPGVSQLFGCTPIGPLAWTLVIGSSAIGTGAAALAQHSFTTTVVSA